MKIYKCTKRMEAPTKSLFDFFFLFLLFFENTWYTKQGTWFQAHVNKINFLGWKRSIDIGKWCTAETRIRVKNLSWRNGMLFSVVRLNPSKEKKLILALFLLVKHLHSYQNISTSIQEIDLFFQCYR